MLSASKKSRHLIARLHESQDPLGRLWGSTDTTMVINQEGPRNATGMSCTRSGTDEWWHPALVHFGTGDASEALVHVVRIGKST
jgi:hypothetical protein